MILFSNLWENKKMINQRCRDLVNQLDKLLSDYSSIFKNKTDYIYAQSTQQWKKNCESFFSNIPDIASEAKKLSRAEDRSAFLEKINKLTQTMKSFDQECKNHNVTLIRSMIENVHSVIGKVEGKELNQDQLLAISKQPHNHLLLTQSSTRKESTVTGLVKYLLKSEKYKSDEILFLSLSSSASEMKERIYNETGQTIESVTIEKLIYNILSEADNTKTDISKDRLSDLIKEQIKVLTADPEYLKILNSYILGARVMLKTEFEFKSKEEYDNYISKDPLITVNHERVQSNGALKVANYLYMNGIRYIYEGSYKKYTERQGSGQYHPDFYLPEYNIYIEYYCADEKDQPIAVFKDAYNSLMNWKKDQDDQSSITMIEVCEHEKDNENILTGLEKKLLDNNVRFTPIDPQLLWKEISENSPDMTDRITNLFESVIGATKTVGYSMENARKTLAGKGNSKLTGLLMDLVEPVWEKYNDELRKNNQADLNDLIYKAIDKIRNGSYQNKYKMVIIDQYHNITMPYYKLLMTLRQYQDYDLFCICYDWRNVSSIKESNIILIQFFSSYWGPAEISEI